MTKNSSQQNRTVKAVALLTAVLLCLGTFFVFFKLIDKGSASSNTVRDIYSDNSYLSSGSLVEESAKTSLHTPSLSSSTAILTVSETGDVLFEKDADRKMPMASTTKIMTAIVAIESCDVKMQVTIPSDAVGIEGSSIYLYEGETLLLEELLYAMMLESANDAATAIAIAVGGSVEQFADMMNTKVAELGLESTHFTNPHGLDDPDHYTTARELAKIAAYAMRNEVFRSIVGTKKISIPLNGDEGTRLLINHNKMLRIYDGANGLKTGYTKKSGRCLVSSAQRDGLELIAVTLNAPDDWNDHSSMLDYGFSLLESRILCENNGFKTVIPMIGGDDGYVMVENSHEVRAILPKHCGKIEESIMIGRFLYAPIYEGQAVGKLIYSIDGRVIAECDIIASYTVERITYKQGIFEKIRSIFG